MAGRSFERSLGRSARLPLPPDEMTPKATPKSEPGRGRPLRDRLSGNVGGGNLSRFDFGGTHEEGLGFSQRREGQSAVVSDHLNDEAQPAVVARKRSRDPHLRPAVRNAASP